MNMLLTIIHYFSRRRGWFKYSFIKKITDAEEVVGKRNAYTLLVGV